ncbi:acyl-CoA synthetase [Cupriavidus numazuensis]|uniref:2-succinylbenzoate--CoA ligase n=1 Tax=Cupriavidus numazuensis TaxID=221992 RepID=A0ABN7Q9S2_9BURK|nr:acyl-CoA synthetase [Cupriavidus numazuensis]CAG2158233.1 2-succinylbenzoate--CoA ligase [Cupriavidus numazuensis]
MQPQSNTYWSEADLSSREKIRAYEEIPLTERRLPETTYQMLRDGCAIDPDKVAIWYMHTGCDTPENAEATTYRQLWRRVNQTANLLSSLGIGKTDVVSLLVPTVTESQFLLWGGQAAGIINPVNWMLDSNILEHMIGSAEARVLAVYGGDEHIDLWPKVSEMLPSLPNIKAVVSVGGRRPAVQELHGVPVIDFEAVIEQFPDDHLASGRQIQGTDVAALFHTGGTTGTPKLAPQTHRAEVFSTWAYGMVYGTKAEDVRSTGLPVFHVGGALAGCLHTLVRGATLVLMTSIGWRHPTAVSNFWNTVEAFRISAAALVPTIINQLLRLPIGAADISSLRVASTGTAPLSAHVAEGFKAKVGIPLLETYGMTESTSVTTSNPRFGVKKTGSAGLPFPYQSIKAVRIDAKTRSFSDCAPNEAGSIVIEGPAVFDGYLDAAANGQVFLVGKWLDTGDLGYIDEDGYLWITGRAKDLIIRGGHNIDPRMIEEAFFKHPDVIEVAAIGVPDAYAGEMPGAYVVVKADAKVGAEQLLQFGAANIPERAAVPKHYFLVDELPKTSLGKVNKAALRVDATQREYARIVQGLGIASLERVEAYDQGSAGVRCRVSLRATPAQQSETAAIRHALSAFTIPYDITIVQ